MVVEALRKAIPQARVRAWKSGDMTLLIML